MMILNYFGPSVIVFGLLVTFSFAERTLCPTDGNVASLIPDCNCKSDTVEKAAVEILSPMLKTISESRYFRYFFVDLEKPCPFWQEDGMCMMEACSVCACDEDEIPIPWKRSQHNSFHEGGDFGWISDKQIGADTDNSLSEVTVQASTDEAEIKLSPNRYGINDELSKSPAAISMEMNKKQRESSGYLSKLHATEDCDTLQNDWTTVEETEDGRSLAEVGVYVNLLSNPERYTGYRGVPAQRVWSAIADENCFLARLQVNGSYGTLEESEQCLETRVFHRLISGLRASITIHIAREYKHSDGHWGPNPEIFLQHIAPYPDRMRNLHFTFLFLLRAVAKAEYQLVQQSNFDTGDIEGDKQLRQLIVSLYQYLSGRREDITEQNVGGFEALAQCALAFNETKLFRDDLSSNSVSMFGSSSNVQYFHYGEGDGSASTDLREQFRQKFRNISRILDCVSCEKCRLWGKLQILGIGTAVKVLLHDAESISQPNFSEPLRLRRQEIIALVNTLNQFTKSVDFASKVLARNKMSFEVGSYFIATENFPSVECPYAISTWRGALLTLIVATVTFSLFFALSRGPVLIDR